MFSNFRISFGISSLLLLMSISLHAQIKEEIAKTVKKPTLNVKNIEKKQESPELPDLGNTSKIPIQYQLQDVAAESDFEPSPLPASPIKELPKQKLYENYIEGAYGNLAHFWLDAYAHYPLNDAVKVGLRLQHNSTEGLKNYDYNVNTSVGNTQAELFVKDELKNGNVLGNIHFGLNRYNLYGSSLAPFYFLDSLDTDIEQKTTRIGTQMAYTTFKSKFFNKASFHADYFKDRYKSKELDFGLSATLDKTGYIASIFNNDFDLGGEIPIFIAYTSTKFDQFQRNSFGYLHTRLSPTAKMIGEQLDFKLGLSIAFLSETESSESDFYLFPRIRVEYKGLEVFQIFAGLEGGLEVPKYRTLLEENAYLSPDQVLSPRENTFKIFGGIKGQLNAHFSYNAEASFAHAKNILFFNKRRDSLLASQYEFDKFNTLNAVYDHGKIIQIKGSLQYHQIENLQLGMDISYNGYALENYDNILNRPNFEAQLNGNYQFLNNKLNLGAQVFFVGQRKTNDFSYIDEFTEPEESIISLDSYVDANFTADYEIKSNLNVFTRLLNVLNSENQLYVHYPMQGFQVSGGVLFKF